MRLEMFVYTISDILWVGAMLVAGSIGAYSYVCELINEKRKKQNDNPN